ncbi:MULTISPECIES: hypothetical protein [unclassified Nocardia]|uniref:hypothetical protein n=1 Tax=unclassified Nocardia TaxID=2637762 RepID=UPI0033D299AE
MRHPGRGCAVWLSGFAGGITPPRLMMTLVRHLPAVMAATSEWVGSQECVGGVGDVGAGQFDGMAGTAGSAEVRARFGPGREVDHSGSTPVDRPDAARVV